MLFPNFFETDSRRTAAMRPDRSIRRDDHLRGIALQERDAPIEFLEAEPMCNHAGKIEPAGLDHREQHLPRIPNAPSKGPLEDDHLLTNEGRDVNWNRFVRKSDAHDRRLAANAAQQRFERPGRRRYLKAGIEAAVPSVVLAHDCVEIEVTGQGIERASAAFLGELTPERI